MGWVIYTQVRARRQGLPAPTFKSYIPFVKSNPSSNYPAPRSSGPIEWLRDQFERLRNRRSARGAYEETGGDLNYAGGGRRGRGLEDDAWDTRVGNEYPYGHGPTGGYGYEEQELGLAASTPGLHNEPYGGGSDYIGGGDAREGAYPIEAINRGRPPSSTSRNLGGENPFGDQNEAVSLRSVSPRPEVDTAAAKGHTKGNSSLDSEGGGNSSPTSTRKSVFREGI